MPLARRDVLAVLLVLAAAQPARAAPPATWTGVEHEIAEAVNAYRASAGLPPVATSAALTTVARAHVRDLARHWPDARADAEGRACGLHSWSPDGPWTPVCWTGAPQDAVRMWSKPREITRGAYPGLGFEIVFGPSPGQQESPPVTSAAALDGWRGSPLHDAVMLERGVWAGRRWRAMGVGVLGGFAVVWFGDTPDPAALPPPSRSARRR